MGRTDGIGVSRGPSRTGISSGPQQTEAKVLRSLDREAQQVLMDYRRGEISRPEAERRLDELLRSAGQSVSSPSGRKELQDLKNNWLQRLDTERGVLNLFQDRVETRPRRHRRQRRSRNDQPASAGLVRSCHRNHQEDDARLLQGWFFDRTSNRSGYIKARKNLYATRHASPSFVASSLIDLVSTENALSWSCLPQKVRLSTLQKHLKELANSIEGFDISDDRAMAIARELDKMIISRSQGIRNRAERPSMPRTPSAKLAFLIASGIPMEEISQQVETEPLLNELSSMTPQEVRETLRSQFIAAHGREPSAEEMNRLKSDFDRVAMTRFNGRVSDIALREVSRHILRLRNPSVEDQIEFISRLISMNTDAIEDTLSELGVSENDIKSLLDLRSQIAKLGEKLKNGESVESVRSRMRQLVVKARNLVQSILGRIADGLAEELNSFSALSVQDGRMGRYFPELMLAAMKRFGLNREPGNQSYLAAQLREQAQSNAQSQWIQDRLSTGVSAVECLAAFFVEGSVLPFSIPLSITLAALSMGAAERSRYIATLRSMAHITDASSANAANHNEDQAWLNGMLTLASALVAIPEEQIMKLIPKPAANILALLSFFRNWSRNEAIQSFSRRGEAERAWKRFVETGKIE